jgi:hypothetical protein
VSTNSSRLVHDQISLFRLLYVLEYTVEWFALRRTAPLFDDVFDVAFLSLQGLAIYVVMYELCQCGVVNRNVNKIRSGLVKPRLSWIERPHQMALGEARD